MSHNDNAVLTRTACLVRYGRLGWVALFSAAEEMGVERGDRVVIQTERGEELGELLSNVAEHLIGDVTSAGEVLRLADDDDASMAADDPLDLDELIGTIPNCWSMGTPRWCIAWARWDRSRSGWPWSCPSRPVVMSG